MPRVCVNCEIRVKKYTCLMNLKTASSKGAIQKFVERALTNWADSTCSTLREILINSKIWKELEQEENRIHFFIQFDHKFLKEEGTTSLL